MKVFLRTYGCRANQYDSEQIRALVEEAGGAIVAAAEDADVAIFNSCAVTGSAEAELRKEVRRAARVRPGLPAVITGCAAALPASAALGALPGVRDVIPGADLPRVAAALALPATRIAGARGQSGARALLRIQDGCDEHCTFCATTLARGASRSRPARELLEEARRLAEHHAEIVLTGVHIGSYGDDIGLTLGVLLADLLRAVPGVRFRLSSIEATEVDDALRELLGDVRGSVVPHLHAPLQSGSDRILRRMGRHWYDARRYATAVRRVVAGRSVFALGADIIAGFPGESEADHRATLALVEELPFTYLHVFPYSSRPGTAAGRLRDVVEPAVVARRARELREAGARKSAAYRGRRVGGVADVVVVGSGGRREGLTEDYLTVSLADSSLPRGSRVRARLALDGDQLLATTHSSGEG